MRIGGVDFSALFELVGLLAKYFGGAWPIPELMKLKRRDLWFWYNIYELQITEEEIAQEYLNPLSGKPKKLPPPEKMRELVDARIAERKEHLKKLGRR